MSIEGRRVVVTGAGNGIGRALAERLAAGGARVVVNDLDETAVTEVAERIGAQAVSGDAASEAGAERLYASAAEHLGEIDIWFGNAGVEGGMGLQTSEAEWARSWEINVLAHVRAAKLLMPRWLERGEGRYVVTASAAGLLTMLGSPAYSVTKHGAIAFAEWLCATYRHRGVVVQAICPQGVQTRMLDDSGPLKDVLSHDVVLTPQAVADVVVEALDGDRFLILPHPEVATYYTARAQNTDRWLGAMNRIQQQIEARSTEA